MAQQFAKMHGGTATEALAMFQRSGVQPTAAAMAEVAKATERTATAVATAAQPSARLAETMQRTHESSRGFADTLGVSEGGLLRAGGALVGVGLGLNLAAGIASKIHEAVVGIATSSLDWERSLKNLSGLYGDVGQRAAALANAQANLPGVLGTQQEFASAAINASDLRLRYGLSQQATDQLTTTGGRVAFAAGMTSPQERAELQQQIAQAVRTGASLPSRYGIYTDDEAVARRLGFQGAQSLQAFTPQQLIEARTAIVNEGGTQFADRANANRRAFSDALTNAEKLREQAESNVQATLEGNGAPVTAITTGRLAYATGSAYQRGVPIRQGGYDNMAAQQGNIESSLQTLAKTQTAYAQSLADSTKAQQDAELTFNTLAHSVEAAGASLLSFAGSLEDQTSIAHGDLLAQAQGAVTARAQGANPPRATTSAEISAVASGTAWQQVYQQFVAPLAQQQQSNAIEAYLQRQAATEGPGLEARRAAAQAAVAERPRREAAQQVIRMTDRAGDMAGRAGTEAQAQLDAIGLRSDERRLVVAEQMAGYRRESLQLEGQISSLALRQADLGDRMVVASRENLNTVREVIRAQQAALPANFAVRDIDYQQQQLELRAQQSRVSVIRGGGPTEDLADLRRQYRELELNSVDAQRAALEGNRGVELAQRTQTTEGLERGLKLTDLEEQRRALEDQLIPLEQAARYTAERQRTVERTLELLDIEDTKARTAAQQQLNSANQLKLVTDEIARQAEDYAAGLNLGATAADRAQAALEKARDFLKETIPLLHTLTTTDVDARIANGLGAGGLGPSPGAGGVNIVIHPNAQTPQQFKDDVHQAVEDALNRFFAGAATAAPGAPSTVGGAGR
jgi:hypothetical protein